MRICTCRRRPSGGHQPWRRGPEGNPNGSPYANEQGGTIAVKPETVGMATYDPYATPGPFADIGLPAPRSSGADAAADLTPQGAR